MSYAIDKITDLQIEIGRRTEVCYYAQRLYEALADTYYDSPSFTKKLTEVLEDTLADVEDWLYEAEKELEEVR